ncbi:MAG: hypothetical protein SF172_18300 [Burkholderiales bacterium]|nr:hypothetical protein [Burkholderiales bacterium]
MKLTSFIYRLFLIISILAPAGCMTQHAPAPVTQPAPSPTAGLGSPVTAVVRPEVDLAMHVTRVRLLTPPQLQAELAQNRLRAKEVPSYENRLRTALTLWAAGGEDQEIQALAEPSQANNDEDQLRGIGVLLTSIIAERRRNRELQTHSMTRNRESRREQESQQVRVDALKRQIDDLERKLAAMRDLEKSLQQRP